MTVFNLQFSFCSFLLVFLGRNEIVFMSTQLLLNGRYWILGISMELSIEFHFINISLYVICDLEHLEVCQEEHLRKSDN